MKTLNLTIENELTTQANPLIDRVSRTLICRQLDRLCDGEIILHECENIRNFGSLSQAMPISVTIEVTDSAMWREIALGGALGAAEAYMQGLWTCNNLTGLVQILLGNNRVLTGMDQRLHRLGMLLQQLIHVSNRNTRQGSRKNIAAHYDLGNDFFSLFLDDSMMYSSGFYPTPDTTLEQASIAKLDRICRKLNLGPGDRVVEIGSGWGGFAIHAAKYYGCHVTTTTLSQEQYRMAQDRVVAARLQSRIEVLLKDYRDLSGQFDKLVSIEMIEAVGHQYLDTYFERCSQLLKPQGQMLLQAITIRDQDYEQTLKNVDFIKKYIFPGGFLPSVSVMAGSISNASDMKIVHLEEIGPHYARTLRDWRDRFLKRREEVENMGFPTEFIRMWEYYLSYCEGGFRAHRLGTIQLLLCKPGSEAPVFNEQLKTIKTPQLALNQSIHKL